MRMENENEVKIYKKKRPRFSPWPALSLVVVIFFIVVWYGIAYWHWDGPGTRFFTYIFPIPAVTVNGSMITYHDLLVRTKTLSWSHKSDSKIEDFLEQVMKTLIEQKVIEQLAVKYKVTITDEEIKTALQDIQSALSEKEFEKKIQEEMNMSLRTFSHQVIEPLTLAQKLGRFVREDKEIQETVFLRAKEALGRVKNGESFSSVAVLYSEDPSLREGGDIGYLTPLTLPEGWDVLLELKEEEVSDVIETNDAFTILKATWIVSSGENVQIRTQAIILKKLTLENLVKDAISVSILNYYIDGDFAL